MRYVISVAGATGGRVLKEVLMQGMQESLQGK
jgi:hypothetical protein